VAALTTPPNQSIWRGPRLRLPKLPASPVENSLEGRAFVLSGFAIAVLAVVLYGQDYVVPAVGLAIAIAGHAVSYRGRASRRTKRGQFLIAGLVVASFGYFLADSVGAIFGGLLPQANFAILLVAVTSFDLKTRRNCYSSLWISLAILYLAAVYAWDYQFGILAGLWALCLAGFWAGSHLHRMGARFSAPPRALLASVAGALGLGALAFILIPQPTVDPGGPLVVSLPSYAQFHGELENPALPLVQIAGDPSGANTSVDLHYRGRLGDAPVMYVRTGAPAYWRGLVFDQYRAGVWSASRPVGPALWPPYVPARLLGPGPDHNLGTFVQVFRIVRPIPGLINAAYPIQSLYAPVSSLKRDEFGTFRTPQPWRAGQTYSVVSYIPDLSAAGLAQDPPALGAPEDNGYYLDAGLLSQAARNLAQQATVGHHTSQYDTVMALTNYLQQNYQYSQQLGHVPSGRDPVDWFLFDVKIGYCEQFATAETLMLRSLGIPARLATGYSTGQYDPVLDQSVVRERDAHAWVEVWFPNDGWVPVDPSPGYSALPITQFPNHWAGGGIARLIPHLAIGAMPAVLGSLGALAVVLPAVVISLLVVFVYAWLRRRRTSPRRLRPKPGETELLRLYERLQKRAGRRRAPPETPSEYWQWAQETGPRLNVPPYLPAGGEGLLQEVTEAVNEGAYAGRWPNPEKVREMALGVPAKSRRRL
jgi:protein-glutamine gamma-glutamyltransferase